jgi:hypothetical protein
MQCVLTGIDTNGDDCGVKLAWHGVLLLLIAPHKHARGFGGSTAGPSHSEKVAAVTDQNKTPAEKGPVNMERIPILKFRECAAADHCPREPGFRALRCPIPHF